MHVLVVTTVHVPNDARILHRQIRALLDAGHQVTYAAGWTARGQTPPEDVTGVDLPASAGRQRLRALRAARRLLARPPLGVDVVVLHDPELLLAAPAAPRGLPVVWDVHEDLAASLADKRWLPRPARRPLASAVQRLERRAERQYHLLLAEQAYAGRFRTSHPVVPNLPWRQAHEPLEPQPRAVYVGRVSRGRGAMELVELGERLAGSGVQLALIGAADADVVDQLAAADRRGILRWHGFLPNPEALRVVSGSLVGLSLLHDTENYRHSMPTKVLEYMERGVPVVTTPLPLAREIVERHRCGFVVPFGDVSAAARAVLALHTEPSQQTALARAARSAAVEHYTWNGQADRFVQQLETWAAQGGQRR